MERARAAVDEFIDESPGGLGAGNISGLGGGASVAEDENNEENESIGYDRPITAFFDRRRFTHNYLLLSTGAVPLSSSRARQRVPAQAPSVLQVIILSPRHLRHVE
jgi:hypothetical protein